VDLTDEQKSRLCTALSMGCDREVAASLVGCTLEGIKRQMQHDAQFAAQVCQAEAASELAHLRNVQAAAKDVKNWRASVWWLERRSPERYAGRKAGVVTVRQLKAFVAMLVEVVSREVRDAGDQQRVMAQLASIGRSVGEILDD
jgi:hypothetical protein